MNKLHKMYTAKKTKVRGSNISTNLNKKFMNAVKKNFNVVKRAVKKTAAAIKQSPNVLLLPSLAGPNNSDPMLRVKRQRRR